ncbi:MAG: hypothetical protein ACI8QD_002553 [Cyclobacteriaceae bacterium]|jgi:hypothetical protein
MRPNKAILFLLVALFTAFQGFAQSQNSFQFQGYLKNMSTFNFPAGADSVLVDNLIHNRLNLRWYPSDRFNVRLEIRNRIFLGDVVSAIPNYGELIDVNNDYFDASWLLVDRPDLVVHTMIDRAYVEWKEEGWSLQLGRQRINWGVNLAWNPNDIFNAYSFFDFDYEERPGSDAIRFQRYKGYAGGYEIAIALADSIQGVKAGFLYKWNVGNYDLQTLIGIMKNNLVIGSGWAGSLGGVGFKGEFTYFEPFDTYQNRTIMGSLAFDYLMPNSLYLNASALYNSAPLGNGTFALASSENLDVRSLSPFDWSVFIQGSFPVHPLINAGVSVMAFPGHSGIFVNPTISWGVVSNFDLDVIGQLFINGDIDSVYALYARLKWSF